jgi:hypothetical protein
MKNYSVTHPNARNAFYSDSFISVDLVELHLFDYSGTDVSKYYCNGGYDITWNSTTAPTAGDIVYLSQGDFIGFSGVEENFDVKVGKFSIVLSAIEYATLSTFLNNETEGSRVVVYKAFLSKTTGQILDTPIMVFDGQIHGYSVNESSRSATIQIDCSSIFADFERVAARKTNNESNWLFQGVKYDTALEKSGIIANTEYKWGRLN